MKEIGFLEKVLGKIDKLNPKELQSVLQRLLKEKGFLETLFDAIEDGILVLDENGKIIYFNSSVTKLIGLEPGKDIGKNIHTVFPYLDWETTNPFRQPEGKHAFRTEIEVEFPIHRQLRVYVTPLSLKADTPKQLALIFHDITEFKKKTIEEVESERLRALTLLGGMLAHEIGNPLNALSIHTQLIQREIKKIKNNLLLPTISDKPNSDKSSLPPLTDKNKTQAYAKLPAAAMTEIEKSLDKLEGYTKTVSHEIDRLDIIVKQYLQAIRPSPPKLMLGNINITAQETVEFLKPEIEKRQIVLKEHYAPELPLVAFDPSQIKQALTNLIKNAMQAMTKNGTLTIQTGYTDNDVWIAVSDTGSGITPQKMKHLFEPFYTTKEKGSGLGLMIVQRIVRDHRGRIEVESRADAGTTFRIRLPLLKKLPPIVGPINASILLTAGIFTYTLNSIIGSA
ncbi:MAG: two-component system sensor histidine kinase NtrB [Verrucomicrobiia bacterium]